MRGVRRKSTKNDVIFIINVKRFQVGILIKFPSRTANAVSVGNFTETDCLCVKDFYFSRMKVRN
jgi:hypothetical protein